MTPADYICHRTRTPLIVDGNLKKSAWGKAAKSPRFVDMVSGNPAFQRGSRFDVPEFDLISRKAISFGGNFDRSGWNFWKGIHPRGARWTFTDWDFPGMQSAVQVDGSINNRSSVDKGWMVELAFPWNGMKWLANGRSLPPQEGDVWNIFFGRFEKLEVAGSLPQPQPAWSWNKIGTPDTHTPEKFTMVQFSNQYVEDN